MKRIISIFLCALLILTTMVGTANAATDGNKYPEAPVLLDTVDEDYAGFKLISQTDSLALYVSEASINIAVLNKKTGKIWSSNVPEKNLPGHSKEARYNSMIVLGTTNAVSVGNISEVFSNEMETNIRVDSESYKNKKEAFDYRYDYIEVDYATVKNGIRFKAYFNRNKGDVYVLDIALREYEENGKKKETLVACLDSDACYYGGAVSIPISVGIMPYFGAATDYDDGYVFYPDGSGTIAEFTLNHSSSEKEKECFFFNQDAVFSETYPVPIISYEALKQNERNGVMPSMYPVFGMKKGDEAVFGIVTEGTEFSSVKFCPSGASGPLYRVFPVFYTTFAYYNSNNTDDIKYRGDILTDKMYKVEYQFLDGDNANYAGMASSYRDYLIENGLLVDRISAEDKMPLALDIYMNTSESTIFGDQAIVMTTFDQAKTMIDELHGNGVDDMLINISAWQELGDPMYKVTPVYSKIGGLGGLKSLLSSTKEYGYDVFMQVNMMMAAPNATDFKITRDAAKDAIGIGYKSRQGYYFVAPQVMIDRLESVYVDYFEGTGISGFNYEMMAYYIYDFYYNDKFYLRDDCAKLCTQLLNISREDMGKNAVWYGNQYSLAYADWIYDLPITDTGYANTTREVPFAQMVLHSFIPYSAIAGNTFYDDTIQTLKWIEYGYIPYYKLTNASTKELANTEMSVLFSAQYEDWADRMVEKYKGMKEDFGGVYDSPMVGHDMLKEDVFMTTYENGTKVLVNYSDKAYVSAYGTVGAESYLIVKG